MAATLLRLSLLAPLVWLAVGVSPEELESFFFSPSGLGMSRAEAHDLAVREATTATRCGVTVTMLKSLKTILYDPTGMDLSMKDLRTNILPLAHAHVEPATLTTMWSSLSSVSSLNLPRAEAQERAVDLALRGAATSELRALWSVLHSPFGMNLPRKDAQAAAMDMAAAGADAAELSAIYLKSRRAGGSVAASLNDAERAAVVKDADGLPRRYAKDAKAYTAAEFQTHYSTQWVTEWLAAPHEKRVARDSKAYTAAEFRDYFGASWHSAFVAGAVATQKRLANDGSAYTIQEFKDHYADSWQQRWWLAPEVPCIECQPYVAGSREVLV